MGIRTLELVNSQGYSIPYKNTLDCDIAASPHWSKQSSVLSPYDDKLISVWKGEGLTDSKGGNTLTAIGTPTYNEAGTMAPALASGRAFYEVVG